MQIGLIFCSFCLSDSLFFCFTDIGMACVCLQARIIILTSDRDDGGDVCHDEDQQRENEHEDQAQSRVELFLPCLGVEAVSYALRKFLDERSTRHVKYHQLWKR